ncbi:hypothetical protein OFDDKENP_00057 [Aeromonas phage B614]|nr:hypothetical protein OFDDKENP_00057 [Aeromonas phage B614]UYD58217.1 hypothetical protein JNEOFJEA_00120 [Aeromonas phage UP87]UYD58580.1 hypothetical protein IPAKJDPM_00237 [Aeromonas phage avDM14-QBC]UYD58794.1 hypothetical protein HNNIDBEH_00201 [Aeromonas phage avDM10-HWA]UYD58902.1 hypothetical protein OFOPOMKI_00052 [Aeromonas phage avDM7-IJDJ]UYD59961.1 hypothetical protein LEHPIFIF_00205 [Aeromonas phage avDM9-HANS]
MSIVTEKFFNYKSFFIEQINRIAKLTPPGCNFERGLERSMFLREYRTIIINMGRMSGKTTGLLQLAAELIGNGGSRVIVMNPANKRHVQGMIPYHHRDGIRISVLSELSDRCENVKFLLVDESEFTLSNRRAREEVYDWASRNGVEFVIMT